MTKFKYLKKNTIDNMVLYTIIVLIILIIFLLWAFGSFLPIILQILINGILLWLSLTRPYVELIKEKNWKPYLAGFLITALVFAIAFKHLHLFASKLFIWWETLFIIVFFTISQLIILGIKIKNKE